MNGNRAVVAADYSVINLRFEYPGFVGAEKYAIVSDLGKEELEKRHGEELRQFSPYIMLSKEAADAMYEFGRNEDKYAKRKQRTINPFGYEEGTTEACCDELVTDNLFEIVQSRLDKERLQKALSEIPEIQRRRVEMYYFEGLNLEEISAREGINVSAIWRSITAGLNRLKKKMEDF